MQSKLMAAILVLLLVAVSFAGCVGQEKKIQELSTVTPTIPSSVSSAFWESGKAKFCANASWQMFVANTYSDLTKLFGNSTENMKLKDIPQLNNTTWHFTGDWFVIAPYNASEEAAKENLNASRMRWDDQRVCSHSLFAYYITDPNNFTSKSTDLTIFYLIPSSKVVGHYGWGGIPSSDAIETSYYITAVKYPEKRVIGTYFLKSPKHSLPSKINRADLEVRADVDAWVLSHHIAA